MNAQADRTRFTNNATRQHMYGGTLGNAIIKNKLFNFFSLERWRVGYPGSFVTTVPTAAERGGDFSQTYNIDGGLQTVFDPYTTQLNSSTGAVTRTPFPGNKVPQARFDPVSASLLPQFWDANGRRATTSPMSITSRWGTRKPTITTTSQTGWTTTSTIGGRCTDAWAAITRTTLPPTLRPNKSKLYVPTGTSRGATQVSGDGIWTANARTVVNFHGDWHKVIDAYVSEPLGSAGWGEIWPSNAWYKSYQDASPGVPVYFPNFVIGGVGFGGRGFYWDQKPEGMAYSAKISHQRGSHFLKAGLEHRRGYGVTFVGNTSNFYFPTEVTAETFSAPIRSTTVRVLQRSFWDRSTAPPR